MYDQKECLTHLWEFIDTERIISHYSVVRIQQVNRFEVNYTLSGICIYIVVNYLFKISIVASNTSNNHSRYN